MYFTIGETVGQPQARFPDVGLPRQYTPPCVRLQNAWVSDRTLCYLASGKPAVVQHTGPSRILPDRAGLFRFRDCDEAAHCLDEVAADYDRQCRLARELAAEHFDASTVVARLLERALG